MLYRSKDRKRPAWGRNKVREMVAEQNVGDEKRFEVKRVNTGLEEKYIEKLEQCFS